VRGVVHRRMHRLFCAEKRKNSGPLVCCPFARGVKIAGSVGTASQSVPGTQSARGSGILFLVLLALCLSCRVAHAQSNEWAWMGGTQTAQPGVYGTLGVAAATNLPGSRSSAVGWSDKQGRLWLFGGNRGDVTSALGGNSGYFRGRSQTSGTTPLRR